MTNRGVSPFLGGGAWSLFWLLSLWIGRSLFGATGGGEALLALLFLAGGIGAGLLVLLRWKTGGGDLLPATLRHLPVLLVLLLLILPGAGVSILPFTLSRVLFSVLLLLAGAALAARLFREAGKPSAVKDASLALVGAALAVWLGAHVLLPAWGLRGTALAAALLFLLSALTARASNEGIDIRGGEEEEEKPPAVVKTVPFFLGIAFAFMAIACGRTFDLILGPSLSTLAVGGFVLLLAAALGALLFGPVGRRRTRGVVLALLFGAAAAWLVAAIPLAARLPYTFLDLLRGWNGATRPLGGARLLVASVLLFPPALFLGGAARLAERELAWRNGGGRGTGVDILLFLIGLALARFLAPVLVPSIGVRGLFQGAAAFSLLAASLLLLADRRLSKALRVPLALLAILFLAVLLVNPPRWRPSILGTGVYHYLSLYSQTSREDFELNFALLPSLYEEGKTTTLLVSGVPGSRILKENGYVELSDTEHLSRQVLLGRLPLLYRPEAKRCLVLGAGGGVTLGTLLRSDLERVRCVEVEDVRWEAIRHFSRVNHEPWKDNRLEVAHGDPRVELSAGREGYDLIVALPTLPASRFAGHRWTEEFFRLAASRLAPGGVMVQPLPVAILGEPLLRSLLSTFRSAYRHVVVFQVRNISDVILLGSDEPLMLDIAAVREVWRNPLVDGDFDDAGIRTPEELVTLARLNEALIDEYAGGSARNEDSRGFVELATEAPPLELIDRRVGSILLSLHLAPEGIAIYDGLSLEEGAEFDAQVARSFRMEGYGPGGMRYAQRSYLRYPTPAAASLYGHFLDTEAGDLDSAIAVVRRALDEAPGNASLIRQLADYLFAAGRYEECDRFLTDTIDSGFRESWCYLIRGKTRLALRRHEEALRDLHRAKDVDRLLDMTGKFNFFLGMAYKNLGRLDESQNYLSRAFKRNPGHIQAWFEWGENKLLMGQIDRERFEEDFLLPMNRARAESLFVKAEKRFYEPQHAEEVERDLLALLNSTPNHFGAYILLARFYDRHGDEEKERAVLERMLTQFGRRDEVIGLLERELRRSGGEKKVREFRDLL